MLFIRILQSFLRSFFLQTLWNYERMQNIGFAFSVAPLLKKAAVSREAYQASLRRHLTFFNTHPYFAPIVMGVVYQKEAAASATGNADATIPVLKDTMGAAFGGLGDHVIWGTWRPFCALLALAIGLLVAYPAVPDGMNLSFFDKESGMLCARWWIVGFLGLFNALHIWLRWQGLYKGAKQGPQVVGWVQSLHLQKWASQIRRLGLLIVSALILGYLDRWRDSTMLVWMIGTLLGAVILKRWSFSGTAIFYAVCAASVAMTWMGIHWP